jgi:hypothetical protein
MSTTGTTQNPPREQHPLILALAWVAVGLPLLWGVVETLRKALALFHAQ